MSTPSSSSSSVNSPSSSLEDSLKIDLTLDDMSFTDGRSDPLEFLLQSISTSPDSTDSSSSSSSSQANSPPEWPQMQAWPQDTKLGDMNSDFDFSFPMDLDFNSNPAVDPSSLHFNTSMFSQQPTAIVPDNEFLMTSNALADEVLAGSMFSFDSPVNPWTPQPAPVFNRRLSITSSSSSSGASLSPVIEHRPPVSTSSVSSGSSDNGHVENDPAFELAQRVRQVAGVTLAVPVSAQVQQMAAAGGQAKLPIPRLPRSNPIAAPVKRVTIKPPPSPEPSFSSASASPPSESPEAFSTSNPQSSQPTSTTGRAKTSHTTIERRYRTNLNARITGLKQAVPALRVLEPKSASEGYRDVVDSRGFVDGVKVARKMSKANILGKATEYIRVLKKRESRLKREQDGLKSLIAGLVGGPALLKEWEREWRDKFGGEERDEVEDDNLGGGSDDEDGDGEDSDAEDEEGRARKKMKVVKPVKKEKVSKPAPPPIPTVPGAVPEKRKRGRPRKNPLPPVVPSLQPNPQLAYPEQATSAPSQMPVQQHGQPVPQYLLAAFAFFSVFNSPIAKSYHSGPSYHTHVPHHGTVLTKVPSPQPSAPTPEFMMYGYGVHDIVQAFHLLVSTLVLFYVILPWLSGLMRQNTITSAILTRLASIFDPSLVKVEQTSEAISAGALQDNIKVAAHTRKALTDVLVPEKRGAADEADYLRAALGVSTGVTGLLQGVMRAARTDRGIELNQLEQRAWVRMGELVAIDSNASMTTRLQTYWCMSCHISTFSASPAELSTLALIIRPLSSAKASSLWDRARNRDVLRPYEKLVLQNMTIDDAAEWLAKWQTWHKDEAKGRCAACEKRTPLGVLAAILIRERLRRHAASLFVKTVVPPRADNDEVDTENETVAVSYDEEKELKDEKERRETIEAGKAIGGRTADLALLLEKIWNAGFCAPEEALPVRNGDAATSAPSAQDEDINCEDEHDLASTDEAEIRSLLSATLIYKRIFPSALHSCGGDGLSSSAVPGGVSVILSPPPSPSRKNLALHTALKAALDSRAFEAFEGAARKEDEELGVRLDCARDRVADMLVELEKPGRRFGRY